ncbi:hypothetical protein FA95DRAFT_1604022 [Auriscalpium vulgare]|uniref:Uncharacterized protein n=1 Tax=Auriscalpium vulgare TaxID=40419 RepID=A0ACB8S0A5_9AGAM|nr:hypothetical protein FA95DRAFT_1604022 [Auriscalpium vulgare]
MEEYHHTRPDSGLFDVRASSSTNLPRNAALFAGTGSSESLPISRTTSAGIPVGQRGDAQAGPEQAGDADAPTAAKKVPLYKRRWFIISQIFAALLGIGFLFILLFPVIHAIAQHVVNVSVLNIDTAAIINPVNTSFTLRMDGWVSHTGIFNAKIAFVEPINVTWLNGDQEVPIGQFNLTTLSAKSKRAYVNQTTTFLIPDEGAFGQFTQSMITSKNFTWRLESNNVHVQALKFPKTKGIHFKKEITLNAINSFDGNVGLKDFQLPGDDPKGGIFFDTVNTLSNPSPFLLDLGTVIFDLYYQNVFLGTGTGLNTVIAPGPNDISLAGTLVPHNDTNELALVSQLFTTYLNGEAAPVVAVGRSTLQNDGTSISWLTQGIQALRLNVPFKSPIPINPIQAISIGDLALAFSADQPWLPVANSKSVQAALQLPFGFSVSISEIENSFNITKNGTLIAGLSTPPGSATSAIHVINSTLTQGTINLSIIDTPLTSPDSNHPAFSQFNADLTDLATEAFQLEGHAHTVADMALGRLVLDPIKFNVTSGLKGLQGLQNMVTIGGVDVIGGTSDAMLLGINVSITNPSNLKLSTGDLSLQLSRGGSVIGANLLRNLTLEMGQNILSGEATFTPNVSPQGQQTLNEFVGKKDVELTIAGYDGSTNVTSLLQAFKTLALGVTLPGLTTSLLSTAALTVLPTTGHANNISHVSVALVNPFTAGLDITQITSTVSYRGVTLGTIQTGTNFTSRGKATTDSPALDLDMNMDPPSLFTVTRVLAEEAGLGTEQLDGIVALGGYQYVQTTGGSPPSRRTNRSRRDNLYTGFNLPQFVDAAFKKLASDVELTTAVTIGDYSTSLQYTQTGVPTKTDESLNLILPILAQPIVQKIVSGSLLGVNTVLITNPQLNSFETKLSGSITQAGPFDAAISFGQGLVISWSGAPLGSLKMPDINITGDVGAQFEVDGAFSVADVDHLTEFTKVLLTEESFDWVITGENLSVSALGISVSGISLPEKKVTLKGLNGLQGGVIINSFDLPTNDPAGGIHLTLDTSITNPAQVGIELSSIGFQNYFGNTNIGPAASNGTFTLAPQSTVPLSLVGRLIPQTEQSGLSDVSTIFNNFIHGLDSNVSVHGDSAGPNSVTWLNEGIKSLIISAVLPSQGKLTIIKSINLNELDLQFTPDTAYGPSTSSNDTTAAFGLPFNFPVDIKALEQNISVSTGGQPFAELVVPKGPSTTDVQQRIIHLGFSGVPFAVFNNQHGAFQDFLASTATSENQALDLAGNANTDASTAVGLLSLTNIAFSVSTSIAGLQGLNSKPSIVTSLDVNHGFPDYLLIKVSASLFNPSNITLGAGDVEFGLLFQDQQIGTADISDIVIIPGNATYAIDVHYAPQGGAVSAGQALLENYLQGVSSDTTIQGSQSATVIDSLKEALSEIRLSPVTIPALHQNLIGSAALTFPVNIVQTGIAATSFTLSNPFTASINLLRVTATATFKDLTLGKIENVDLSSSPVHADGHSNVTSALLPFEFNLDPLIIIKLLLYGSRDNHVDLGPLVQLFGIVIQNPSFHPPITTTVDTSKPTCVSGKQFDVDSAILNALKNLLVTLAVDSQVKLDDYATQLTFNQYNVPAITDQTALYLIGAVAPPILQTLVSGSELTFTSANITNISDDGFDLALKGSLTNIGPLDALITFVEPVTVTWQGHNIAQISLPPICGAANDGVPDLSTNGHLTITDQDQFTAFATYLLHNPSFTWTISTNKLRVTALGTIFDGVSLTKDVSFKAFNNLPGVTISNFQLPSDDPAGGIHIETDSLIPSPAQLGIDLGNVGFRAFFENTFVGPLSGANLVLPPQSTVKEHLTGRIVPQSGDDLNTIGKLFSQYLAGDNQTLSVYGDSVQPTGSSQPVTWLSTAFKTLVLEVILPGQKFTIIDSITLSDLEVVMTESGEAFAPLASSQHTLAEYKNPFGFSLQVVQAAEDIILGVSGTDIAELKLPINPTVGGVSTGNLADLQITFENRTLQSLNDAAFALFFAGVTDTDDVQFELHGTADVVGRTSIGDVPIAGIPFDVGTALKGIGGFGGKADLSDVKITGSGGGGAYVNADLTTTLQNPSNISLLTNDVSFAVFYEGTKLGRAVVDTLDLVPGQNEVPSHFHYQPDNANDTTAQSFLSDFLQSDKTLPLTIKGDSESSPYGSLIPALEGVSLSSSLQGLNLPPIITHINAYVGLDAILHSTIDIDFDITNSLDAALTISFSQVDSGVNGETYAHFDQAFSSFTVPAHSTANSGKFGNVFLTQGAVPALLITPLGRLDVFAAATVTVEGGYTIPWLHLKQLNVPTNYDILGLGLGGLDGLKAAAQSLSLSEAGKLTSAVGSVASGAASAITSVASQIVTDVDHATSAVGQATSAVGQALSNVLHPTSLAKATNAPAAATPAPSPSSGDAIPVPLPLSL